MTGKFSHLTIAAAMTSSLLFNDPSTADCPHQVETGGRSEHRVSARLIGSGRTGVSERFGARIEDAFVLLRRELGGTRQEGMQCHRYFSDLGVNLDHWLAPNRPPYVFTASAEEFDNPRICGSAQTAQPFSFLFVNSACSRRLRACDLASLVLHEMGHLARQDVADNEPASFFEACNLGCVDPGVFR